MRARVGGLVAAVALVASSVAAVTTIPAAANSGGSSHHDEVKFDLTPSTPAIAACLPHLRASVEVELETDQKGRDEFEIRASGLPANQDFTVFLLETPGTPFGAAEYIGDFSTDASGRGRNSFKLIVAEAFSSTLVNGTRVRADLNHVGFWFADPAEDDVCFGPGGGAVTPFDGDNEAGVQVMNSANALPGAPLPPP
ncbi:MAG TPA: hypothetical protein VFW74_02135 [Acidimicrobiia bacterium]|nr:hypothetical protein [Acidimicrobiia bacterium]